MTVTPSAAPAAGTTGRRPRVLLGDSEGWAVDLLRGACERLDAELHVARNGVEALEQFKSLAPSVVVLDTLLSKLDGLQAAAKIRDMELGRIRPIIVTSAIYRPGPDVDRLQRRFGFTDFLPKPFTLDEVVDLIGTHLREETEAPAPDTDLWEDGQIVRPPAIEESPLAEMGVPALLCQLFRGRRSGVLTLRRGEITKVVFFERGHITHARSNSRRDRLGRILLRSRKITLEDYERARRLQTEASGHLQLGTALVQLGVLNDNDVANAVASQILNVIFSLFEWDGGTWSFLDSADVPPEYTRFNFNTANLIFWGLRQLEGRHDFARFLPGPRVLLERPSDMARLKEQLNLTYLEEQVLGLVDGRKRLGEILALGRLARLDVERVMFSLLVLGVLRAVTEGAQGPIAGHIGAAEAVIDPKGSLVSTSVARVFARLHVGAQTGVVTFRHAGREAAVHFDGGELVYARSNRDEHRLGNILLRAGTIAPGDHERAVAAVEGGTDRKIGTVLIEMRAISLEELHAALRFQVQDIVLDLFRWREGEYVFEPGAVATDLVVSIPGSTANLVLEGARVADPPPGVLRLLHTPGMLLIKLWGDEQLQRSLQLTAAERRLLSFIETGRSAAELRNLGLMSEPDLGRALHGLLALEVVKAMPGAAVGRVAEAAHPASVPALESLNEEDTPFPPTRLPRHEGLAREKEEACLITGTFSPRELVSEPAATPAGDRAGEIALLRSENDELKRRLARLERELLALRDAQAAGRAAGARAADRKPGDAGGAAD